MRVVVDSNIWISGLLWRGAAWNILRLAQDGKIEIWSTRSMLEELQEVLKYPRLQPRQRQLRLEIADLIAYATALVSLVDLKHIEPVVLADPDDDVFVACAVEVGAEYLVSGDKHLLNLRQWQGVLIVPPDEFLRREFPPS